MNDRNLPNGFSTRKLVIAALFTALVTVSTLLIQIPTPTKGYVNLGDCFVNISAWILGPAYGSAAAGIGSAFADIISGYSVYAPATLVIKALMAFTSFYIVHLSGRFLGERIGKTTGAIGAELIMVLGYASFEFLLYQSAAVAMTGIPANLIQGIFGAASSVLLYEEVFRRIPAMERLPRK